MPEVTCGKCPPLTEPDSCSLQVKCVQCGHESNTHQAFLDLSLDIRREKSVRNALQVNYCDLSGMLLPRFAALTQIWQSFWVMHGTCLPCMSCRPVRFASRRSSGDCMCRRSALNSPSGRPQPTSCCPLCSLSQTSGLSQAKFVLHLAVQSSTPPGAHRERGLLLPAALCGCGVLGWHQQVQVPQAQPEGPGGQADGDRAGSQRACPAAQAL